MTTERVGGSTPRIIVVVVSVILRAAFLLVLLAACGIEEADPLVGAWRPRAYQMAEGGELPVDGRISFRPDPAAPSRGEWFVLFFVTGESGEPARGSAEGGEWSRDGNSLLLTHTYHLSAGEAVGPLAAAPLSMALRSAAEADRNHREPCEVEVEGDRMTLRFPSGNSMTFERVRWAS